MFNNPSTNICYENNTLWDILHNTNIIGTHLNFSNEATISFT